MVAPGSRTMIAGSLSSLSLVSINPAGSHSHPARDARALAQGGLSLLLASELPTHWEGDRRSTRSCAAFSICEYNVRADDDCQEVYA